MKKETKKVETVDVAPVVVAPTTADKKVKIATFSGEFGRVDINLLRDKVNEIVDYLNK